jgi:hypothetical protein
MASKRVEIILDLNDQEAMNALKAFQDQFKATAQVKEKSSKQEEQALRQQAREQEKIAKAQEKARRDQEEHDRRTAQAQQERIKREEDAKKREDQARKAQAQADKERIQAQRLQFVQGAGRLLTAGASTAMGIMTSSDASGVINALGGGAGQGINALGGLLSNLGMQKTGSIVQTAGALVPMIGQGVAQAIGQVYSRFTEVAGYELPRMLAGSRFNDVFRATEAPKIGGAYGYSMGESLNNLNAYASAYGTRNVSTLSSSQIFTDIRSAEMLGVNPMAIPQFASLGGMGGAMQSEEEMAGIARGVLQYASKKDMLGSQAEKLLGAINAGIQGMASKGLSVDAQSLTSFIIGVSNAGIKSVQGAGAVRAVQGIESIAGQAKGGYLGNFQGLAMQALQAEAAATSDGSPLGMINKLEELQADPRLATQIIKKRLGGTVSRLALGGAGLSQAQITALFGAGEGGLGTSFDLTGQIGDQLDVTKKLNTLERQRVERNFDFSRTQEGTSQLETLLNIQQKLEIMIENIGTSDLATKLTSLADAILNYLK